MMDYEEFYGVGNCKFGVKCEKSHTCRIQTCVLFPSQAECIRVADQGTHNPWQCKTCKVAIENGNNNNVKIIIFIRSVNIFFGFFVKSVVFKQLIKVNLFISDESNKKE